MTSESVPAFASDLEVGDVNTLFVDAHVTDSNVASGLHFLNARCEFRCG